MCIIERRGSAEGDAAQRSRVVTIHPFRTSVDGPAYCLSNRDRNRNSSRIKTKTKIYSQDIISGLYRSSSISLNYLGRDRDTWSSGKQLHARPDTYSGLHLYLPHPRLFALSCFYLPILIHHHHHGGQLSMRSRLLQDAPRQAHGAVHLPLRRVSTADLVGVWHVGHLSPVSAPRCGVVELLYVR